MASSSPDGLPPKPDNIEIPSRISMQKLDPSPVHDEFPDVETGEQDFKQSSEGRFPAANIGLRGRNWDSWLSALQRYSTYPPTFFLSLHFINTSLIPLATRSVPDSENFLLLTRPAYQSPSLEHLILTAPILIHIASGIALRNIRSSRLAKLYGAESRSQRYLLQFWPRLSLQARLGYSLIPLLGSHVLVNRAVPVMVDGGSSGVGLGYVAHGFARSPVLWNAFYLLFVATGVWHIVGGWASWVGWRVTTARTGRVNKQGSLEGYLSDAGSAQRAKRQRKLWWLVNGLAAFGTSVWLAGALGIIGRAGEGSSWEAGSWNRMYNQVPVISSWL